jgi:hypothetical protein
MFRNKLQLRKEVILFIPTVSIYTGHHTDTVDKDTHSELLSKMSLTASIASGDVKVPSLGQLAPRTHFK